MKNLITIAMAAALLLINFAQAGVQKAPPDMNKIVKLCLMEKEQSADTACQAFVAGVVGTSSLYATTGQMNPAFCIPEEIAPGELVAVFRDYLGKNKALKHFPASALAVSAFKEGYPCPQQ